MDVVTKATGTVTPVEDSKSKHGEFDVILSTSALDRDGDELHPDEWKTPLPDKITFDSDHGMSVATCVGSGSPFINEQGQLQVRGTFASTPHGQAVRTLVKEGHITSVSVAFMNHKNQKSGKPLRELLNGAFVAVPANPEARVLAAKAAAIEEGILPPDVDRKDGSNLREDTMAAISALFDNDPLDAGDQSHKTAYLRGIRDLAMHLGAGFPSDDPDAVPSNLQIANRSVTETGVTPKRYTIEELFDLIEKRWSKPSPTESTEESTAPTAKAAGAADESADDVALLAKKLATNCTAFIA